MIGFYVHHHGSGHRTRATQIAGHLHDVVGFGSMPRPEGWPGEWVTLPDDDTHLPVEPTAGGVLHWAPLDHPGHAHRLGILAQRLAADLDVLVVDTSAEVALLARLMGVRTVLVALRGERLDRPHLAAYDAATRILAPWPRELGEPSWPVHRVARTDFVGAISRFDGRVPRPRPAEPVTGGEVLVVWGAGGTDTADDDIAAARAATPGWRWTVRSPDRPSPDLWEDLMAADVVVCHAGNNVLAEVAAARVPAVVVAQRRPFGEHLATVDALRRSGCALALDSWPVARLWPYVLQLAAEGGLDWDRWSYGDGAQRAAAAITRVAADAGRAADAAIHLADGAGGAHLTDGDGAPADGAAPAWDGAVRMRHGDGTLTGGAAHLVDDAVPRQGEAT